MIDSVSTQCSAVCFSGVGRSTLSITGSNFTNSSCTSVKVYSTATSSTINLLISTSYFSLITSLQGVIFMDPTATPSSTCAIKSCTFVGNPTTGVMVQSNSGFLNISNSIFANASSGAGIVAKVSGSTAVVIDSSLITNNSGSSILYVISETNSSSMTTHNCLFTNNNGTLVKVSYSVYVDSYSCFMNNTVLGNSIFYITDSATVTLTSVNVQSNQVNSNGLIFLTVSSILAITSSSFSSNSGSLKGGVLFSDQDSIFKITDTVFLNNSAIQGSAIYTQHCSYYSLIVGSTFKQNSAASSGCITTLESSISIDSSTICNNTAPANPAIEIIYYSELFVTNSQLCQHSGVGSHIYLEENSMATVLSSTFSNSYSTAGYSVFKIRDSLFTCGNCTITGASTPGYTSIGCDNS